MHHHLRNVTLEPVPSVQLWHPHRSIIRRAVVNYEVLPQNILPVVFLRKLEAFMTYAHINSTTILVLVWGTLAS